MTSGGNKFNDFPENQLTKNTEKTTNPFFYNISVARLQEHQGENTENDGLVCLQLRGLILLQYPCLYEAC